MIMVALDAERTTQQTADLGASPHYVPCTEVLTVLAGILVCLAAGCDGSQPRGDTLVGPSFSADCYLSWEECQGIWDALNNMNDEGYCGQLQQQGIDTYLAEGYGYQAGTEWGCGTNGDVAGYVVEYIYPSPELNTISDDV